VRGGPGRARAAPVTPPARAHAMRADQIEAYVDAAAAALSLELAAAYRPGVQRYVALAALMAEQVEALALGLDDEPAPQFVPIEPTRAAAPRR